MHHLPEKLQPWVGESPAILVFSRSTLTKSCTRSNRHRSAERLGNIAAVPNALMAGRDRAETASTADDPHKNAPSQGWRHREKYVKS